MTRTSQLATPAPAKSKVPVWAYVVALALIAGLIALVNYDPSREPTGQELRDDASRACQEEFIPGRLKAPATAQFSGVTVNVVGESYMVEGSVDAANTFGTPVRSRFSCVMHQGGDRWVLDSAAVA